MAKAIIVALTKHTKALGVIVSDGHLEMNDSVGVVAQTFEQKEAQRIADQMADADKTDLDWMDPQVILVRD